MTKISVTSKLDGIKSWSLEAVETCPGAHDQEGGLVTVCQGCYARGGNYRFKNVKNARRHNKDDWKRDTWVDDMIKHLQNERYFRWFDSGDIYSVGLARKILELVKKTPWCNHWIPTRSHKFAKFKPLLEELAAQPNAVVRYSADEFGDSSMEGQLGLVLFDESDAPDAFICRAYENEKPACNGCRACWDKNIKKVAYIAHGKGINKLKSIPIKEAA